LLRSCATTAILSGLVALAVTVARRPGASQIAVFALIALVITVGDVRAMSASR
jgi:hypothetical protein